MIHDLPRQLGDEEIRDRRRAVSARARRVMAGFIAERRSGPIPADQVEPSAEVITSGLAALALWWIDNPEVPKRTVLEVAVRATAPSLGG